MIAARTIAHSVATAIKASESDLVILLYLVSRVFHTDQKIDALPSLQDSGFRCEWAAHLWEGLAICCGVRIARRPNSQSLSGVSISALSIKNTP
jgi:hypothetical protein